MFLQDVERSAEVPHVLGQRVPPGHHGVDEVGVAGVVIIGIPVLALSEAAEVRCEDDVAAPGQLVGVVGVGHVGVLETDRLGLAGAVAVAGQHRRTRAPSIDTGVRHEEVGRHRHGVLAVEDHLVAAVTVAVGRLEDLEVQGDGVGLGAEELVQRPAAALAPRGNGVSVFGTCVVVDPFEERILVDGGAQAGHPLVPG